MPSTKQKLYTNIITLRLSDKQLADLRLVAEEEDVSMTDIIRETLNDCLAEKLASI